MRRLLLPAFALISAPAAAQDAPSIAADPEAMMANSVFDGDFLVVGVGAASLPSYEGSNDRAVVPAAGLLGRVGGLDISPRAAGLALDLLPERKGERIDFSLGPVARYNSNRTRNIKDPVVAALGKLDAVIEGGIAGGVTLYRVFNGFDRLSFGSDVRWDISGKGAGRVIAPGLTYFTPVSKGQVIGGRVGAEFVDSKYANYNYAISPAGSAASGLPQYSARGGFKEWNVGAFTAFDLSGNFLDGGFAVGAGALYSRLHGSAAESPITSVRGKRGQFFFGGGLAYTF